MTRLSKIGDFGSKWKRVNMQLLIGEQLIASLSLLHKTVISPTGLFRPEFGNFPAGLQVADETVLPNVDN